MLGTGVAEVEASTTGAEPILSSQSSSICVRADIGGDIGHVDIERHSRVGRVLKQAIDIRSDSSVERPVGALKPEL